MTIAPGPWDAWLAEVIYPKALAIAALPADLPPADVLAMQGDLIACYAWEAGTLCEELGVLEVVATAVERSGSTVAAELGAAIEALALAAAYEYRIAQDLLAVVPPGCGWHQDDLARERVAEQVVEQWRALDEGARASFASVEAPPG